MQDWSVKITINIPSQDSNCLEVNDERDGKHANIRLVWRLRRTDFLAKLLRSVRVKCPYHSTHLSLLSHMCVSESGQH